MRLPRDVSGKLLAGRLEKLGYSRDRQSGSHLVMTPTRSGMTPISIPQHKTLDIGLLAALLRRVAEENGMSVQELRKRMSL